MASVGSILEGAFGLVRRRPGAIAIWGLTYVVGSIAIMGLMALIVASTVGFAPQPSAEMGGGAAGGMFGAIVLIYVGYALLSIVLINAVYRAILRPHDTSFASMRIGGDEFRMLGLTVIFVIGMVIFYFITVLIMMLVVGGVVAVAGNSPGIAGLFSIVSSLGFLAFWVWLGTRLSLIFPMTFHRRRFAIDEGWALGRGRFWTLFGAYLVMWIIIIVAFLIFFGSTFAGMFALIGAGGDPAARGEALTQMMAARAATGFFGSIVMLIGMTVISLLSFVLGYGVVGSAARELLNEQGDVTEDEAEHIAQIFD